MKKNFRNNYDHNNNNNEDNKNDNMKNNNVKKNRLRQSKKAVVDDLIHYIPRILYLIIVLSFLVLYVSKATKSQFETLAQTEGDVFFNHLLYSSSITYYDPFSGRYLPAVIDLQKFTTENVERGYANATRDQILAAELYLADAETDAIVQMAYFHKQQYEKLVPISGFFNKEKADSGKGSSLQFWNQQYVLYVDKDGKQKKGMFYVGSVVPRS